MKVLATLGALTASAAVVLLGVSSAPAPAPVTTLTMAQVAAASVGSSVPPAKGVNACWNTKTRVVTVRMSDKEACPTGTKAFAWLYAGETGPQGPQGIAGPVGPAGPAGKDGTSWAPVTASGITAFSNHKDSGVGGDWADDDFTRSATIKRGAAVQADKCGPSAVHCWFWTGTLTDTGSFTSLTGAKDPATGTKDIAGIVTGTFTGGATFEFYAEGMPTATPQGTVDGAAKNPTSEWYKQFFAADANVTGGKLTSWAWDYNAPKTCESFHNAGTGNTGNILGVNACTK